MVEKINAIFRDPKRITAAALAVIAIAAGAALWTVSAENATADNTHVPVPTVANQQTDEPDTPGGAYVHVIYRGLHNADWYQFILKDENDNRVDSWDVMPVLPKSQVRLIGDGTENGRHVIPCGMGTAKFEVFAWRRGENNTSIRIARVGIQNAPVRTCDNMHVDFETEGGGADVRVDARDTHGADQYRYKLSSTDDSISHSHIYVVDARETAHYVTLGGPGHQYRLACDGGPGQRSSSSGERKARFEVSAWKNDNKIRDIGWQLAPVHACPPPKPEESFTESVNGPYAVAVVADADFAMPDGNFMWWRVPMAAAIGQSGTLNYEELYRATEEHGPEFFEERTEGDMFNWGRHRGYVVRVNLSDLVDEDVDLSDPKVCNSIRVAYKAQLSYSSDGKLLNVNTRIDRGGYEALVLGCGGSRGAREASAGEARIVVPVAPLGEVHTAFTSFPNWTVELQPVDSSGNAVGSAYRSGDYSLAPDGTMMALEGQWWHAISVPYADVGRNFAYEDCYGLRFKRKLLGHSGDVSNSARMVIGDPVVKVENCWRAPLAAAEPALAFPLQIEWNKVTGADGYVMDVIGEENPRVPVEIAPHQNEATIFACNPSGDDNAMRIEVRPYVIPLGGSMEDRVEWPGTTFDLPCPNQ